MSLVADTEVWTTVCRIDALVPDRGVCALIGGRHVAVFLLTDGEVVAIDNVDPFCGASVLSRGLVGSDDDGTVYVASPLRKQRFDVRTGRCLDDATVAVDVFDVTVHDETGDGGVVVVRDAGSRWGNGHETGS